MEEFTVLLFKEYDFVIFMIGKGFMIDFDFDEFNEFLIDFELWLKGFFVSLLICEMKKFYQRVLACFGYKFENYDFETFEKFYKKILGNFYDMGNDFAYER